MQTLPQLNNGLNGLDTVLKAGSSILQGVAGLRAGQYNQGVYAERAQDEVTAANAQALMLRDQARAAIGDQLGGQYAHGFEGGTGSALDLLQQSQVNQMLDMMELRRQGAMKSRALLAAGDQAATEGDFALAKGLVGAVSDVATQRQDWAAARAGQIRPPKRAPGDGGIVVTRGGSLPIGGS